MTLRSDGNWGLKLLALTLAVIIYLTMKAKSPNGHEPRNSITHEGQQTYRN